MQHYFIFHYFIIILKYACNALISKKIKKKLKKGIKSKSKSCLKNMSIRNKYRRTNHNIGAGIALSVNKLIC
jgi:hypothetical protein